MRSARERDLAARAGQGAPESGKLVESAVPLRLLTWSLSMVNMENHKSAALQERGSDNMSILRLTFSDGWGEGDNRGSVVTGC